MSIETLLAANIKATEALTEALTGFGAAITAVAGGKKTSAKTTTVSAVADPAATSAAPAGAAAGSAAGGSVGQTAPAASGAVIDASHPFSKAVTALAKAHGRDVAIVAINMFGAAGRASNVKEIDREKAHQFVLAEHKRLDEAKAAAAQPKQEADSLI